MIVAALLLALSIDSSHNIARGDVNTGLGEQRWYKETSYQLCPQEHRWNTLEWRYLEKKSAIIKLAPDQVDEWDNNGIDFA